MKKRMTIGALTIALTVTLVIPAISTAAWPVSGGGAYVSQRFHDGHRGLDIAARHGSTVMPIWGGKVIFAGWKNNCGGWQVWLQHPKNTYTAYYHLARETTSVGAYVYSNRSRIGTVGATGCATGPHVHVEVWKGYPWRMGSYRVNPWHSVMNGPYLPSRYR